MGARRVAGSAGHGSRWLHGTVTCLILRHGVVGTMLLQCRVARSPSAPVSGTGRTVAMLASVSAKGAHCCQARPVVGSCLVVRLDGTAADPRPAGRAGLLRPFGLRCETGPWASRIEGRQLP